MHEKVCIFQSPGTKNKQRFYVPGVFLLNDDPGPGAGNHVRSFSSKLSWRR